MPHSPTISGRVTTRNLLVVSAATGVNLAESIVVFSFAIAQTEHKLKTVVRYIFFIHLFKDINRLDNLAYF